MTRDQFIDQYIANNAGLQRTPDGVTLGHRRRVALPCACGHVLCEGWAMINDDPEDIALHNEIYAPQEKTR